ncbi:hypothetical protein FIA58_000780 [Flavobacterium jejuense]|uniref:Lipocalin-like domain-containing protein n=1 Tax=Flavobacterium jejuense TaxID=1544455 RepID=A0ABX0IK51_9FLAO|nr:hypothetical protein [Flavobacterium jejuense]NHN24197.1 hypothetical protein [Flavobacterium jejuense]
MKLIVILLFFFSNSFHVYVQSENYVGNYTKTMDSTNGDHTIRYTLELHNDGTFEFHSYNKLINGIPQERNTFGRGTWTVIKNIVHFHTETEKDFDEKYTLDFNNSTARFDHKDKTIFRFYKSKISWMELIALKKE